MQKRAFIFKGCEVKLIRQIGLEAPFESMVFFADLPDEIENVFSAGSGMVSFVENNGNKYMIVLNNDWRYELQIAVTLNKPAYLIDSDANFTLYEAGEWGFMIPKGGMLAFKYR